MNFLQYCQTQSLNVPEKSLNAVLELKAEGCTIPFIARYRKEKTGNLDEVQIQKSIELKEEWDEILNRQTFILGEIEKQGKLTDDLKKQVSGCFDKNILEDLYLPFKQKRKSKASLAREAGLEPLAEWIWEVGHGLKQPEPGQTLDLWAFTFKNEEKGFNDSAATIQGATDLLIERLSENLDLRQFVRNEFWERGFLRTVKNDKSKENSKYSNYFKFQESVKSLKEGKNSHRYLAIRRGWIEEEISISFGGSFDDEGFSDRLSQHFQNFAGVNTATIPEIKTLLDKASQVSLKAHVLPSIENEVHKSLKESADLIAIEVFCDNVKKLLLAAPYGPKGVLGVDPGIRTGCKVAVVDAAGKFLADTVLKLQSEDEKTQAKAFLTAVAQSGQITAIAVGNGTAGRETESFIRAVLKEAGVNNIPVVLVSESGASIYSASPVAREEFPNLDLTVRGAISIARRLQDPLAELVKVDPKSIGVGQYQHDVSQPALKRALDTVVDSCVNSVGVNLNTSSSHLLAHISGIGEALAKSVVEFREQFGLFKTREDILKVPRFSKKAFEQAAGFIRVPESTNLLEHTSVHPERYADLEAIAKAHSKEIKDLIGKEGAKWLAKLPEAKEKLGEFTLRDIVKELEKPGRDPREEFQPVSFRDDLFALKDVQAGMICPGIVTNVTNFGAFVDIGVHQDGLVHISQIGKKFITDPKEVLSPGDRVTVRVLEINLEKSQMSLTMRMEEKVERTPKAPKESQKTLVVQYGETPKPAASDRAPIAFAKKSEVSSGPSRTEKFAERASKAVARPNTSRSEGHTPIKSVKPQVAFNNPFAALAGLKDSAKK